MEKLLFDQDRQIGDNIYGGIVFYIDSTGVHGLVSSMDILAGYRWGCYGIDIDGADGSAIGTGYQNTLDIVAGCSETSLAASEALAYDAQGYSDWYLPSISALQEMYNTIGFEELNFESNIFLGLWSSSELNSNGAWYIDVISGNSNTNTPSGQKGSLLFVLPIRSF